MENINASAINETAKTAGATVEGIVKETMFAKVAEAVEPTVAKKIAKRTLMAGGVLTLCGLGYFGYRALKKTKAVVIITEGDAANETTTDTTVVADDTAA
ncbi:hypothetical protein MORTIMER_146 [Erwinia phage vB_EamM_Mortimer]|uniref:Uncharacterized protein n=1 Tax=Erwinia phage vB_EamM_Mortimer TaxID=2060129 RepID=A0A2H5BKV0_9CAUD|nr:hypothetical protein MORTIMER_146 [Erwinia phage vB_EamM_Mortimer]